MSFKTTALVHEDVDVEIDDEEILEYILDDDELIDQILSAVGSDRGVDGIVTAFEQMDSLTRDQLWDRLKESAKRLGVRGCETSKSQPDGEARV